MDHRHSGQVVEVYESNALGRITTQQPFSRQNSITGRYKWDLWLSKSTNTFLSMLDRVWLTKCFINCNNSSPCIQPDLFTVPIHPVGPPLKKWCWNLTRGKINIVGMALPVVFIAKHIITKTSRSANVIAPICFLPLVATILDGAWTVVMPVSSMLLIRWASTAVPQLGLVGPWCKKCYGAPVPVYYICTCTLAPSTYSEN